MNIDTITDQIDLFHYPHLPTNLTKGQLLEIRDKVRAVKSMTEGYIEHLDKLMSKATT